MLYPYGSVWLILTARPHAGISCSLHIHPCIPQGRKRTAFLYGRYEEALYHDTWKLLKKYRDVVWSLELSVQQVRNKFEIEYGTTIEDFLDSVYLAGADIAGSDIEHHAQCIERSHRMLKLLDSAIDLLRNKHKNGESYYWLLYYSYLSPQQLRNVEEIIEKLRPHIRDISMRTYYRKRQECIGALSSILWGYTSKDSMEVLEQFIPGKQEKE